MTRAQVAEALARVRAALRRGAPEERDRLLAEQRQLRSEQAAARRRVQRPR